MLKNLAMIIKIVVFVTINLFVITSLFSQKADTNIAIVPEAGSSQYQNNNADDPNSGLEDSGLEIRKNEIVEKYNLDLDRGLSSKMLSDAAMHVNPDLSSPDMVIVKQNERVYAYKYFPEHRSWLINYKSKWGFIEDYVIMAVKEDVPSSYKDQWDSPPKLTTSIKPKYTREMKDAGLEGNVELKIFISKKGVITQTIILNGIDGLNDAAIKAINKAKFEAAKKNGKKVGVWVPMRINF